MGVQIVDGNQQLAKPRLSEILRHEFHVPASKIRGRGLLQGSGAAQQVPHHSPALIDDAVRGERRRHDAPPERTALASRAGIPPRADRRRGSDRAEHQHREPRQPRRQTIRRECRLRRLDVPGHETGRAADANHLQHEVDREHHEAERQRGDRHGDDGKRQHDRPYGETQQAAPGIERGHGRRSPEPAIVPEPLRAVGRREQRADHPDAAAADDIELHARLVERAQDARVIGAGGPGPRQHQRGAELRRIVIGVAGGHSLASSWMVSSLTISNSRVPPGVATLTVSPGSLLSSARPIGDVVETRPLLASASSGMTS